MPIETEPKPPVAGVIIVLSAFLLPMYVLTGALVYSLVAP